MKHKGAIPWAGMIGLLFLGPAGYANDITALNSAFWNANPAQSNVYVQFDLSWSNSWRTPNPPNMRDAAWVFVKFRPPGSNDWQHAALSTNSGDHVPAANSAIDAVPDGRGVFIYSATNQTGNVNYTRTRLLWNYGSNGYGFALGTQVEISVHAIEMVYIPEEAFYLGSGGGEGGHFYAHDGTSQTTTPFLVSSETNAITVTNAAGNLYYYPTGGFYGDGAGPISNVFPKGYAAFYCMKYEISQGQYADFLNKLTTTQDGTRFPDRYDNKRHTIGGLYGSRSASAPDRACNWLSWSDGVAYADWAALRPMTELEYEKACRGPATPVTNEYAWGSTNIIQQTSHVGTDGSGTETASPTNANCLYGNGAMQGPVRVGIYAAPNATRESSGAGYYGVMELSGNDWERPVTVGNTAGRSFQGTHGDGVLDVTGNAAGNTDWPSYSTASGAGFRGGGWAHDDVQARVSDRYAAGLEVDGRTDSYGSRAVRSAP